MQKIVCSVQLMINDIKVCITIPLRNFIYYNK